MDKVEKQVVASSSDHLCRKIEALSRELTDLSIEHTTDQLLVKNASEYLLLKEYRTIKLEAMKREAQASLKPLSGTTN